MLRHISFGWKGIIRDIWYISSVQIKTNMCKDSSLLSRVVTQNQYDANSLQIFGLCATFVHESVFSAIWGVMLKNTCNRF